LEESFADKPQATFAAQRAAGAYDSQQYEFGAELRTNSFAASALAPLASCINGTAVVVPGNRLQTFKCKNVSDMFCVKLKPD
jgi:hypothetical protein